MDAGRLTRVFAAPLEPLTRGERIAFAVLSLLVAISRWPAIAKSLWDWDEALFVLAMREYDVVLYHPHPPGFPLFIGAAKLIPADPFHALQTVVVIASLLVFPAMFVLARELRASAFVSIASALVLAFLPNVWFFGGTAFSDVPSLVTSLFACALLLRGCRSDRALIAGCIVLGIAAGIRPQNLLICFAPLVVAFLARRRTALRGLVWTAIIVLVSYRAAAGATGYVVRYLGAVSEHGRYIRRVDSFLSDIRPSLFRVFDDFFLRPFRAPVINVILLVLMAIAVVRRRRHTFAAIVIFGPFLVFAWLMLDFHSSSRFSVAYMPLFALLAAEGIDVARRARIPLLSGVLAVMIVWTWPALRVVHTTDSPPVAAMKFVRANFKGPVDVDDALGAQAEVFLHGYERGPGVRVAEGPGRKTFARPRERLEGIARPRYFDVSVSW